MLPSSPASDGKAAAVVWDMEPDPDKAKEVYVLQEKLKKSKKSALKCREWPVLMHRLARGTDSRPPPTFSLTLIMEIQSYMLAKIRDRAHEIGDKPVYIVIGITGSGKSVTCNWMLGKKVTKKSKVLEDDEWGEQVVFSLEVENEEMLVGTDRHKSATFAPNIVVTKDFVLIDYPGFCDTTGFEFRLGMDLAFRELLNDILHKNSVHVLALVPIESFSESGRSNEARGQLDKLKRLMPLQGCSLSHSCRAKESDSCNWVIGITKCDINFCKNAKYEFEAAKKTVMKEWASRFMDKSSTERFWETNVVNMNHLIFSKDGDKAREKFFNDLRRKSYIPQIPMECLRAKYEIAFGKDVPLQRLACDCLDEEDLKVLSGVIYGKKPTNEDLCSGADVDAVGALDSAVAWRKAQEQLKQALDKMKASAAAVKKDSQDLRETSHLSLERRNLVIRHLARQGQASLKQQFVKAEEDVMLDTMAKIVKQVVALTKQVQDNKCLNDSDQTKVIAKAKEAMKKLSDQAEEFGYKDFEDFTQSRDTFGAVGIGALACMVGHDLLLLTPAHGAVVASGLVATAPIFAAVAIIGVIGAGVLGVCHMRQASWSAAFRDLLIETFDEMINTNEAVANHKKSLTRIDQELRELVLNKALP